MFFREPRKGFVEHTAASRRITLWPIGRRSILGKPGLRQLRWAYTVTLSTHGWPCADRMAWTVNALRKWLGSLKKSTECMLLVDNAAKVYWMCKLGFRLFSRQRGHAFWLFGRASGEGHHVRQRYQHGCWVSTGSYHKWPDLENACECFYRRSRWLEGRGDDHAPLLMQFPLITAVVQDLAKS